MRAGREGGGEVVERASLGTKSVAGRRSADMVKGLVSCKRVVCIHNQPNHRNVGGSPARNNDEYRHRSNRRSTGSRGRSTQRASSARSARRGSSDSTTPCNPTGIGIIRGEGTGDLCHT